MNFVPKLKFIALSKVAIGIYCNSEVTKLELDEKFGPFHCTPNEKWEPFIREKVSETALPEMLQEMIISLIKSLSLQHLTWKQNHAFIFKPSFQVINYFVWTPLGTIERFKTAKRLVHLNDFAFVDRFMLAFMYCLEDDMLILWRNASDIERRDLIEPTPNTDNS